MIYIISLYYVYIVIISLFGLNDIFYQITLRTFDAFMALSNLGVSEINMFIFFF